MLLKVWIWGIVVLWHVCHCVVSNWMWGALAHWIKISVFMSSLFGFIWLQLALTVTSCHPWPPLGTDSFSFAHFSAVLPIRIPSPIGTLPLPIYLPSGYRPVYGTCIYPCTCTPLCSAHPCFPRSYLKFSSFGLVCILCRSSRSYFRHFSHTPWYFTRTYHLVAVLRTWPPMIIIIVV